MSISYILTLIIIVVCAIMLCITALPLPLFCHYCILKGGRVEIWVPTHWDQEKIDGLLVRLGKASNLLTEHLITGLPLMSEPAQEK